MAEFTDAQDTCCASLGGTVENWGGDTFPSEWCTNIPTGLGFSGITSEPCNYNLGSVEEEVESSSSFNWTGLSGLLSTLGAIAVPFLPFLFGTAQSTPPSGGATDNTEELKAQNGMLILVGFVILIALSVGAYIYMKKRRK